jgi:hypothetical protein
LSTSKSLFGPLGSLHNIHHSDGVLQRVFEGAMANFFVFLTVFSSLHTSSRYLESLLTMEPLEHQSFVHQLRSTIHTRDYQRAKALCEAHNEQHQKMKKDQVTQLDQIQAAERHRLRSAKQIALQRAQSAGQQVTRRMEEDMGARQRDMQSGHDDRLRVYSSLLQSREERHPIVYSTATNALRQSEKHLGRLRMFDEATIARDKLIRLEAAEHAAASKERARKIRDCVEIKHDRFLDEERTLYTRMKGELQVQKNRNAADERQVENTFRHLERDMARAHLRQQLLCIKSTATDLHTALSGGTEQVSRTVRGTTMLRKMKGNRFTIPSLCNVYGSLLDDSDASTSVEPYQQRRPPMTAQAWNDNSRSSSSQYRPHTSNA